MLKACYRGQHTPGPLDMEILIPTNQETSSVIDNLHNAGKRKAGFLRREGIKGFTQFGFILSYD